MSDYFSESIKLHDPQAPFYKFRTPYLPDFFKELSSKLSLDQSTKLIDLCCGNGELSAGIVNYVKGVYAVDGSEEMLRYAIKHPSIRYFQADINVDSFKSPDVVNHILIGRAIHWIKSESLNGLVRDNLIEDGKVVICSSEWAGDPKWYPIYSEIIEEYRKLRKGFGFDFTGRETLTKIGFKESTRFSVSRLVEFDLNYLINHSLSISYGESLEKMLKNLDSFSLDIKTKIGPICKDKKLIAKVTSWAIVYEKS